MVSRSPRAAPVKLLALFVLLSGIPLVALGWLGWRVLQQDGALESQRVRERLDTAASLVARELDRGLTGWEALLPAAASGQAVPLPQAAVLVLLDADGVVQQQQGVPLPYYPRVPAATGASAPLFAEAEYQEFREQNLSAAIATYRTLAGSNNKSIRAGALVRLARCFRKQRRTSDALAAYVGLGALGDVPVAGSPAELVARRERIALFSATRDANGAANERMLLTSALLDGRFRIDRPTFEYFQEMASVSTTRPTTSGAALAEAVEAVWPTWQEQAFGRTAWTGDIGTFVSVWRKTPHGTAAMTAGIDALTTSVGDTMGNLQVAAQLYDPAGTMVWGLVSGGPRVTKTSRETGLPWSLHVAVDESESAPSAAESRRDLFVAGFLLMTLVVSAASYFVVRAVNRELNVAHLQADFVAAVSHEFRTPLTAMCHLTEILERGNAGPNRLSEYYGALGKESRRLHTMVENLLDLGRMDSGCRAYEFSETDAAELGRSRGAGIYRPLRDCGASDREVAFALARDVHPRRS